MMIDILKYFRNAFVKLLDSFFLKKGKVATPGDEREGLEPYCDNVDFWISICRNSLFEGHYSK